MKLGLMSHSIPEGENGLGSERQRCQLSMTDKEINLGH